MGVCRRSVDLSVSAVHVAQHVPIRSKLARLPGPVEFPLPLVVGRLCVGVWAPSLPLLTC